MTTPNRTARNEQSPSTLAGYKANIDGFLVSLIVGSKDFDCRVSSRTGFSASLETLAHTPHLTNQNGDTVEMERSTIRAIRQWAESKRAPAETPLASQFETIAQPEDRALCAGWF